MWRKIVGVDPGSTITGWGIIETNGQKIKHVAHGHIRGGKDGFDERLLRIHLELNKVMEEWSPHEASLEDVFVGCNPKSALKLGQARGVAILSAKLQGLQIASYPPKTIKQAVSGNGNASKEELQKMVLVSLKMTDSIQVDAGDALAIAICHAVSKKTDEKSPCTVRRKRRYKGRGLRIG